MKSFIGILSSLAVIAAPTLAHADEPRSTNPQPIAETQPGPLPPSQSDDDPKPVVPMPLQPPGGVVEQAGIGGVTSYARSGVVELGGSLSLAAATDYFRFSLQPSVGWFIIDNVELSGLLGLSYVSVSSKNAAGVKETATQTLFSLLIEPSVHIPFTRSVFGFLGLGMGLSYASGGNGVGFALKPRLGINVMVGRSGILSPAVYVEYSTHSALQTSAGTLLQVSFGYGLNIGYTVMW